MSNNESKESSDDGTTVKAEPKPSRFKILNAEIEKGLEDLKIEGGMLVLPDDILEAPTPSLKSLKIKL